MGEFFLLVACTLLFGWTWIRETPSFWREGACQDLVHTLTLHCFYPALGLLCLALLASLVLCLRQRSWRRLLVLHLSGFVYLAAMCLMCANNLTNWMDGHPLHWHEGDYTLVTYQSNSW